MTKVRRDYCIHDIKNVYFFVKVKNLKSLSRQGKNNDNGHGHGHGHDDYRRGIDNDHNNIMIMTIMMMTTTSG